jgi:hypothetical protein
MRPVFANLSLSQIITWIVASASCIAAWLGLALALRRELREKTDLRFHFEAYREKEFIDQDGGDVSSAIRVTVTNFGLHPISVTTFACGVVTIQKGVRRSASSSEHIEPRHLKHGEHHAVFIAVRSDAIDVEAVHVVDTTGKVWMASKKELRQLRSASKWVFPKMQSINPVSLSSLLRRWRR